MIPLGQTQLISSGILPPTVPGSIHPARCGAGFRPFPSKPACTCQNRRAPKAPLKFSRGSCRALLFPPLNLKPLRTSSLVSRKPGADSQLADSHCKKQNLHCRLSPFHPTGFRAVSDTGFRLGIYVKPCLLPAPIALSGQLALWHGKEKTIRVSPQELQGAS